MEFRIADTFTASLTKLTVDEQKLVKQTAFDAQVNPASPGLQFHKLDRSKDKNFWSLRVGRDIRIIVHRTSESVLFCYTDHHDKAYTWAENRKLEVHPKTGAAQIVEIQEVVQNVVRPIPASAPTLYPLFASIPDGRLMEYGIPLEWLPAIRAVADQDALLELADHLPAEAAEALLDLAVGRTPVTPQPEVEKVTMAFDSALGMAPPPRVAGEIPASAFQHPDAQRRFRLMGSAEELQRALEYPWDKWLVFLHPDQRALAEGKFNGPVKICGSAGTGKTVVALHRAVHLARTYPDARILLTTISDPLANALQSKLNCLLAHEPKLVERIDIRSLGSLAKSLFRIHGGEAAHGTILATRDQILPFLERDAASLGLKGYTLAFLYAEWRELVDARQLSTWEDYRVTPRLGRKTRLSEQRRQALWSLFERVNEALVENKLYTESALYTYLCETLGGLKHPPYGFIIVDEAQDLGYAQMRFVAVLGAHRQDALCFCGDLGQRIFQQPFSWKSLGVDIRGRSITLRVNYRTSHQIRSQADKLLDAELTDADGNTEKRNNPISVFNGPSPAILTFNSPAEESEAVAAWLTAKREQNVSANEMAVFVRSESELPRAAAALENAKIPYAILGNDMDIPKDKAAIAVMHLAKGLEFCAVAVMACDSEVIPSQQRIEDMGEDADLEDVYNTERQLLYVACTRARDHLFVSGVKPTSEFIDGL
jgi:mRNA-degrading endonuclease RelE of RelBE toxin-antitoxin system